jgi:hypothetical protein
VDAQGIPAYVVLAVNSCEILAALRWAAGSIPTATSLRDASQVPEAGRQYAAGYRQFTCRQPLFNSLHGRIIALRSSDFDTLRDHKKN